MKIILLLLLSIVMFSCSSSDDDNVNNNPFSINPPTWIQGTWLIDGVTSNQGYRFSNNDFCLIVNNTETCFKEQLDQTSNAGGTTNVSETITDNNYTIEITFISQTVTYQFEKVSSTQIEWINDPLGDLAETIYIKQ